MVEAIKKPKSTIMGAKVAAVPKYPYEYQTKKQRMAALQTAPDMSRKDPLLDILLKNME